MSDPEQAAPGTPGQTAPFDAEPDTGDMHSDLLEAAWGIIANAGWDDCAKTTGWQDAAVRWRDDYFRWTRLHAAPSGWRTWEELAGSLTRERNALIAENAELRRREPGSERVAELVTEGNELRALLGEILGVFWAKPDGHYAWTPQAVITDWRNRARIDEPVVVTAGTEHLVPVIRGLAIPDEL